MKNSLKKYRKVLKMTQQDLAAQTRVSRQTIISIESGAREPSLSLAMKISKTFNLPIEDVFFQEEKGTF